MDGVDKAIGRALAKARGCGDDEMSDSLLAAFRHAVIDFKESLKDAGFVVAGARPRLIIRVLDATGTQEIWTDVDGIEVISICEHIPRDRVYRLTTSVQRVTTAEIDSLIGESRVGELGDMPGVEAKIGRLLDGKPEPPPRARLALVPSNFPEEPQL